MTSQNMKITHRFPLLLLVASLGFAGAGAGAGVVRGAEPFEVFLENYCLRCHGAENEKGDLRIDQLSRNFQSGVDSHHWAEALDKLNSGEMPPRKAPQPTQAEIFAFVTNLDARLKEGRGGPASRDALSAEPERISEHRL